MFLPSAQSHHATHNKGRFKFLEDRRRRKNGRFKFLEDRRRQKKYYLEVLLYDLGDTFFGHDIYQGKKTNRKMNFYHYFFYSFGVFARSINKKNEGYIYSGLLIVCLFCVLNTLTILALFQNIFKFSVISKIFALATCLLFYLLNYIYLMRNRRYKIIFNYFDEKYKNGEKQIWKRVGVIVYILLSVCLFIYIANLERSRR